MKLRFYIALWAAKCARIALRILGRNATCFPGRVAIKICPDFIGYVGKPKHVIAVTGTNGKTTVCNLLNDFLTNDGKTVMNNQLGTNIAPGIATALLLGNNIFGKAKHEYAVLEVDERSSRRVYPYIDPELVVITNLFRDSIMRNAHPEYIASFLEDCIPQSAKLLLNADDIISSAVSPENKRSYFGIAKMDSDVVECINKINDGRVCPKCWTELEYEYRRYHHIGKVKCPNCGYSSPERDYEAHDVDLENMTITVTDKDGEGQYKLLSDSVHNIYNVVTLVAILRELGYSHEDIRKGEEKLSIVKSRYNEDKEGDIGVIMQMSKDKNALAGSRAFDYVSGKPGDKELILMMNCLGDQKHWSENICWLYDCDFEFLNKENIKRIVCTGPRGKDYSLRLALAGVPDEKVVITEHEMDAPSKLELTPGEDVYIFYGTDSIALAYRVRDRVKELIREGKK